VSLSRAASSKPAHIDGFQEWALHASQRSAKAWSTSSAQRDKVLPSANAARFHRSNCSGVARITSVLKHWPEIVSQRSIRLRTCGSRRRGTPADRQLCTVWTLTPSGPDTSAAVSFRLKKQI